MRDIGRAADRMKPTLDLYIGKQVTGISCGSLPWQWGIVLSTGAEIRNKNRNETFVPQGIIGTKIMSITFSVLDTTLHFSRGLTWSLKPTQYSIYDPKYGGESYPQWPIELEKAGISSHPEEPVSNEPAEGWDEAHTEMRREQDERIERQAGEWLEADRNDSEGTDG